MQTETVRRALQGMSHRAPSGLRLLLGTAVALSLAWCLLLWVLHAGLEATPATTTDSAGRPMGFNDRLSVEHYLVMVRHFRPPQMVSVQYGYDWLLLGAHLWALAALGRGGHQGPPCTPLGFWLQSVFFPLGWPCWAVLPSTLSAMLSGAADRETLVDIPFVLCMAQPVWVMTALVVALALARAGRPIADPVAATTCRG